jgi:IQ calmodulin-binding motif
MEYFQEYYIDRKSKVMYEFYELINETEKYRFKELGAAVKIEALWRMYKQRKYYLHQQWAVSVIKRVFRGYRTRKNFWKLTHIALAHQRKEFFSYNAVCIQRIYRGYYSRKYLHDFYARKKYLKYIEGKNQRRLEKMSKYHQQLIADEQKRQEDYARMEFYKLSTNLHHLTSTKAVPGVYKNLEEVSDFGKHSLKT